MAGRSVLVVEDESVTALDIRQSLRRKGFEISEMAYAGKEAVTLARLTLPDLVLMDIQLRGDMDGIEAACHIRRELGIPVVFLTAFSDTGTFQRAKDAEPSAYLLKPFDETLLAVTLEIALSKHAAHAQTLQEKADAAAQWGTLFDKVANAPCDVAIHLLDAAGQVMSWNQGAERIYGWTAGEILGKYCGLLYTPEDLAVRKPDQDLQIAAQRCHHSEYGCQARKDQSRFSAELNLAAVHDQHKRIAGFLRTARELRPGGDGN